MNDMKSVAELTAEAAPLKELVSYQENAVISRNLIKGEAGFVALFAFDQGEGISEHSAPFDALAYIIEGSADITISGRPFRVDAGEVIIMPANDPHALLAPTRFKMLLVGVGNNH
jgi:quercetin dioxygenase-like cupin family protein